MIIVHLAGGLGNQMFQYAFARANAIRLSTELAVELSDKSLQIHNGFELDRVFNVHARLASQKEIRAALGLSRNPILRGILKKLGLSKNCLPHYIEEMHFQFSPEMMYIRDNTFVFGYWQSEKYFLDVAESIRQDFKFKLPIESKNIELAKQIKQVNAVSLHVRRGDYASNPKNITMHGLCSIEYYQAAIRHVAKQIKNPHFFVFSDDISWVKNNLRIDFPHQYIDHNHGAESYNDMRLMSLCKHNIIANSSFSWWGAWLNLDFGKIVIAPKRWFVDSLDTTDLIPSSWLLI